MIPYLTCASARELLDAFLDGELATSDQVALESHLRWCATCRARVEDMQLIGTTLRLRHEAHDCGADDIRTALATMQSDVLTRVRAERDQSFPVQFRGLFDDARLMWPALGATAALLVCLFGSMLVHREMRGGNPESMADVIDSLAKAAAERRPLPQLEPLTSYYPVALGESILAPRALDAGPALYAIGEDEAVFALSAVVTREGRVATYEVLPSGRRVPRTRRAVMHAEEVDAVLDSVKESRFEPAQGAGGGAVTVRMIWVLARTTVKAQAEAEAEAVTTKPISDELAPPAAPRPARL